MKKVECKVRSGFRWAWVLVCCLHLGCESEAPEPAATTESDPTAEWTLRTSSPIRRLESPSVKLGNKLYLFAGFTKGLVIIDNVGIYDVAADSWTSGTPMPVPVTHMGAVAVGTDIWILGGFVGDHPGVATHRVQIYDTKADAWRVGPALPHPRGSLAAAFNERRIHVFGGLLPDRKSDVGEHFVLDLDAEEEGWTTQADLPIPRNHHSGIALNGLIYAVGGQFRHDGGRDQTPYLHVFDPNTDSWTQLADLPADRSHFEPATFAVDNKIMIVGGQRERGVSNEITVYDPETDSWSQACTLPRRLLAPAANAFGGHLIVAGGGLRGTQRPRAVVIATELDRCLELGD